jgi:hypothetical protein
VLTPDVRFEGWTTESWQRFVGLWKPRATPEREATRPRGGLLVIHDGSRIRKLLHTRTGRLEAGGPWPARLGELAEHHEASWSLAANVGALEEVMERFGARARRGDDLLAQTLKLANIVREMMAEGSIEFWPRRLKGIPMPTDAMVRRALDSLCPDPNAMVLGLFKDGGLYTALAARRRGLGFDVIAGPEELRHDMGLLSGDWRRDYRHLARAVEERYAPLAFGCFAEVDRFRELQVDGRPGAWGRAVAVRDIVVSPVPSAVGLALGVDGARAAFQGVRVLTGRLGLLGRLEPVLGRVRDRLGSAAGDKDVSGTLGFDPMAVLRALLKR